MLLDRLPERYGDSPQTAAFEQAVDCQAQAMISAYSEFLLQLHVRTATYGLAWWESLYGLETDVSKPDDYRRTRIMSKMRGAGTTTPEMIKNVAESFQNGTVEVVEHPADSRFEVKFVGMLGIPPNLEDVSAAIDEIKPAHMEYSYLFSYLLIRDVHQKMTLKQMEQTPLNLFAFGGK